MRWYIYVLMICAQYQLLFCSQELTTQVRVISHQATLPYSSYEKEKEPIKAFFKFILYACTSDEATYILAKDSMFGGLTAELVEACWSEFQENGKKSIVKKSGESSSLRNMDQTVIKSVPFDLLYGFESKEEAFASGLSRKRTREE